MNLMSVFLFPIALIVFILIMSLSGLYKFKGTRFKTRLIYGLALSIFFALYSLWQIEGNLTTIGKGILLGIMLVPLSILYTRYWIEKRLKGGTILYARNYRLRSWLWFIPFFICLQFLFHSEVGKQLIDAKWPLLGLCFSWLIIQVFSLFYISRLEDKLGHAIMEDRR
jgi:hypothetical protein